eukprot:NODE_5120_length_732_cov_2.849195_g4302_i0.p4 GENE.NODE_5120_length_732_cov_2.849195_g4302_i0~~NODE_5120_length_732_cov_2.849195_g4302_i0.p4  ORF type:complete len:69 (+),score=18.23 NODE_5120_length_732_cov_2.849195_g4302_i0:128-334(+)
MRLSFVYLLVVTAVPCVLLWLGVDPAKADRAKALEVLEVAVSADASEMAAVVLPGGTKGPVPEGGSQD